MAYGDNKNLNDYVGVHTRVEKFRADHPLARLTTAIIRDEPLTVRCEIHLDGNDSGIPNATGMADESGGMGQRSKSALEKVETAAVGRALAFLGYEVKEGIASREEVQKAERAEPARPVQPLKTAMPPPITRHLSSDHNELERDIMAEWIAAGGTPDSFNRWFRKYYEDIEDLAGLNLVQKQAMLKDFREKAAAKTQAAG